MLSVVSTKIYSMLVKPWGSLVLDCSAFTDRWQFLCFFWDTNEGFDHLIIAKFSTVYDFNNAWPMNPYEVAKRITADRQNSSGLVQWNDLQFLWSGCVHLEPVPLPCCTFWWSPRRWAPLTGRSWQISPAFVMELCNWLSLWEVSILCLKQQHLFCNLCLSFASSSGISNSNSWHSIRMG